MADHRQTHRDGLERVVQELISRRYVKTPAEPPDGADLRFTSPGGTQFSLKVHSLRSRNWFLFQRSLLEQSCPNRHFIFVLLDVDGGGPHYYVLTEAQFQQVAEEQRLLGVEKAEERGTPYSENWDAPGVSPRLLEEKGYLNAWRNLPS